MRELTAHSSLESLKKEAKAWLKALRAGDPAARDRLAAALPDAPADPGLRDVQLALAREHGLAGWAAVRQVLDDLALALRSHADLADLLLRSAKPWDSDKPGAARIFSRVSGRMPGLSRHSIHAATLLGDLDEVKRRLAREPDAARQKGGPLDWEPILYLAYGRIPGAEAHAIEIATLLLDHGADPAARLVDDWENPFTLLNGVIGQGEQGRSEHPLAEPLADLFIARGTDPFDTQVLYDTSVQGDDTRWLDYLWRQCEAHGGTDRWHQVHHGIGGRYRRTALDYLLGNAVGYNHLRRAEWLLDHGADPNTIQAYSGRPVHVEAQLDGLVEMAALLERHGARPVPLGGSAAFIAAAMRRDLDAARRMVAADREVLKEPSVLILAAQRGFDDVVAMLLDLGMTADLCPHDQKRALHWAAQNGHVEVARRLIAAGADIDRRGSSYQATPLGFAFYFGQQAMIDLLAPLSRDIFGLTRAGRFDRLAQLLREDPALAEARSPDGAPVLFALPDDEGLAAQAAELLLALGADPRATNKEGDTPARAAHKRGLDDAADLIEAAGGPAAGP